MVEESIIELTKNIVGFNHAQAQLQQSKKNMAAIDLTKHVKYMTDLQIAQIKTSPLRDYLRCFDPGT